MKGKYDGLRITYTFTAPNGKDWQNTWRVKTDSLDKAIRRFRTGAHQQYRFVNEAQRVTEKMLDDRGYERDVPVGCKPGAKIGVFVDYDHNKSERIALIDPDGPGEYVRDMLPAHLQTEMTGETANKALMLVEEKESLTGLSTLPRREIDKRMRDLDHMRGELEVQRSELLSQINAMEEEIKLRQKQIWLAELYLGSAEEIVQIRTGKTAPQDEPISVRQRVLCMDEEIAAYDFVHNPEKVGAFDFEEIDRFDKWLLESNDHLNQIFPEPKGMIALRVRRQPKKYYGQGGEHLTVAEALHNFMLNTENFKTYLLIRNGENLYRVWADITFWPRLIPALDEFEKRHEVWGFEEKKLQKAALKYYGGMLIVQGLLERTEVFAPVPEAQFSIFNPMHQRYFNLIRDDENLLLAPKHLTWKEYREWLTKKLQPGVRVLLAKVESYKTEERTGMNSVCRSPRVGSVYVVDKITPKHYYGLNYSFLYLPDDEVYGPDPARTGYRWDRRMSIHPRTRRVRFNCHDDELIPIDYVDWRTVEAFIIDRNERPNYGDIFPKLVHIAKEKKLQELQEQPFVQLVLKEAGMDVTDNGEQAKVRALIRWWKMKVKMNRAIKDDEPKALRMILKAYRSGFVPPSLS